MKEQGLAYKDENLQNILHGPLTLQPPVNSANTFHNLEIFSKN